MIILLRMKENISVQNRNSGSVEEARKITCVLQTISKHHVVFLKRKKSKNIPNTQD